MERFKEARAFVGSKNHVCPLGTSAEGKNEVVYARIQEGDDETVESSMEEALTNFVEGKEGKKVAVLMFPEQDNDLEQCKAAAHRYMMAAGVMLYGSLEKWTGIKKRRRIMKRHVGEVLQGKDPDKFAHLMAKNPDTQEQDQVIVFFMGPCYEPVKGKNHKRWASYPMLVLIWAEDIKDAREKKPKVVERIKEEIREMFGGLYPGNTVVLPQNPRIISK